MRILQKSGSSRLTAISSKSLFVDLRTKSAQNQLQKVLKTLVAQAFSGFSLTHILRIKSTLEQQGDILDGFLLFVVAWVDIPVHGCLEVRLSQDALDRLHICPCVVQHRAYRVPENVRGGPMEVHRGVDAFHHTSERSECQRLLWVVSTDNKALLAHGQEVGKQVWDDGNVTITTSGFGCAQEGLVVGVGRVSLNMDDILHQIKVFPAQAQDFALPHASEDDDGEVEPVCSFQLAE